MLDKWFPLFEGLYAAHGAQAARGNRLANTPKLSLVGPHASAARVISCSYENNRSFHHRLALKAQQRHPACITSFALPAAPSP